MNKVKSILRISVLVALSFIGLIALFCEPNEDSLTWTRDLLISKGIAAAAFFALARLYPKWEKKDPWLQAYEKHCNKDLEAEKPSQL